VYIINWLSLLISKTLQESLPPILYEKSYAPESRDRYGEWWTNEYDGIIYLFGNQLVKIRKAIGKVEEGIEGSH
jgi:hypothetical protein